MAFCVSDYWDQFCEAYDRGDDEPEGETDESSLLASIEALCAQDAEEETVYVNHSWGEMRGPQNK